MTKTVLELLTFAGVLGTLAMLSEVDSQGWAPFFACIGATAMCSALVKMLAMVENVEQIVVRLYNEKHLK